MERKENFISQEASKKKKKSASNKILLCLLCLVVVFKVLPHSINKVFKVFGEKKACFYLIDAFSRSPANIRFWWVMPL